MIPARTAAPFVPALQRFKCMPPERAVYHIPLEAAARMLRCAPEEVVRLTEHGLNSLESGEGIRFDYFDIMNVGRFSQTGVTTPELNALALMRFTRAPKSSWLGPRTWRLQVRLSNADQGKGHKVRIPDFSSDGMTYLRGSIQGLPGNREQEAGGYEMEVRIDGVHDPVRDPVVAGIYSEFFNYLRSGDVIYQAINEPLRLRHWEAWSLGIADCMVTSRVLADRLRSAGVQARARRGFILGFVGSEHAWCEVFEDGRWKSLDVTLAAMPTGLSDRERLPAHDIFSSYCLGGRFNRCLPCIAQDALPIMYDSEGLPLPMIAVISATTKEDNGPVQ